jgi:hypothetical protein
MLFRKITAILFILATLSLAPLLSVGPVYAATITVDAGGGGDFTTILAAINAANNGDTILVSDGTYTEDLSPGGTSIEKSNLTIRSVNGPGTTTIQLVDGVGIDLGGGASNFTLGGAAGQGFTILSGAGTTFMIQLANAPSDVTISHNIIDTTGNATQGISVGAAGATSLTVSNNTFTSESGDFSIWGPNIVSVNVSNNTFTVPGVSPSSGWAVQFAGVTGASTISNNTINDYSGGIAIANGKGTSGLTISNNTVDGCYTGIKFLEYTPYLPAGNMTTVSVTRNTLSNNYIGLQVNNSTYILASNFTITCNVFIQNYAYGLKNAHATEAVTAENNWWGANDGPDDDAAVINGSGDKISLNVDADPWLVIGVTANPATIDAGGTQTSNVTASMNSNSDDAVAGCSVPDGTQINFATTLGTINGPIVTTNGIAVAVLTPGNTGGTAIITAAAPPYTAAATANVQVTFAQEEQQDQMAPVITSSDTAIPQQIQQTPPKIMVTNVNSSTQTAQANQSVIIFANVVNRGDTAGYYTVNLKINDEIVETKTGSIGGHAARPLEFTVSKEEPGYYNVDINGEISGFTVINENSGGISPAGTTGIIIGFGLLAIIICIVFLFKRNSTASH